MTSQSGRRNSNNNKGEANIKSNHNYDVSSDLRRNYTQPAGLSKYATDPATEPLIAAEAPIRKSKSGRFQQFRLGSGLATEELTHFNKENHPPEAPTSSKRPLRRRMSFSDIFHRKSHRPQTIASGQPIDENENIPRENLNERIAVWFADTQDCPSRENKTNSIFLWNKISPNAYFVSSFGKQGTAKGDFQDVKHITLLPGDRMLVTDFILSRINMCNASGRLLLLYTGTDLFEPWATTALDNQQIAMTSRKNHCVKIFSIEGEVVQTFGEDLFKYPAGIAMNSDGLYIVCDAQTNMVSLHNTDGTFIRYLGNQNDTEERLTTPRYVCVSATGEIIVSDSGNHKIKVYSRDGDLIRSFGSFGSGQGQLKFPYGVCTNQQGDIFVADHYNNRICVFSLDGEFLHHLVTADQGLRHPQALAISDDMILYVSHGKIKANEILTFDLNSPRT